ncbi:MAG: fused MFS/spermidine synthase [Planctomycetota bacterium]
MLLYALTIPLGAFLLFLVQPILGRHLVPKFGGGAGVWTACMLFFQTGLLLGYGYAHFLAARLRPKAQAMVHGVLLLGSLLWMPIALGDAGLAGASGSPTLQIAGMLLAAVGLPYVLLSSTGPLLQHWFRGSFPTRSPYRLYALSNAGSLAALLLYPFLFEPVVALRLQTVAWTLGYALFALAGVAVTWRLGREIPAGLMTAPVAAGTGTARPGVPQAAFWLALSTTGSIVLLATTNRLCQDLAAVPLLWVLPLAIYLLTFILCFDHERWYDRRVFVPLLLLSTAGVATVRGLGYDTPLVAQVSAYGVALLAACMVCHGELYRARPAAQHLTAFYLMLALGGALGGAFVALGAPALFVDYWEYEVGLLAAGLLMLVAIHRADRSTQRPAATRWGLGAGYVGFLAVAVVLSYQANQRYQRWNDSSRSFYSTLHVERTRDPFGRPVIELTHGGICHGTQFLEPDKSLWPTSYYGPDSGLAVAMDAAARRHDETRQPLHVGVVGLGAGTVAVLAEAGDAVRFYEIDPSVEDFAREHFTFLARSKADVDVVIGDARIALEDELRRGEPQRFDVLALDAFSGDAIPLHLLTEEAFAVYESHLAPGGVIAFHVSNRYVDVEPVVRSLAKRGGYHHFVVMAPGDRERIGTWPTRWALLTKSGAVAASPKLRLAAETKVPEAAPVRWTDDHASLWSVLGAPPMRGRWEESPNHGRFVLDAADMLIKSDEDELLWRLRRLYADSGGACPILVVSVEDFPEQFQGQDSMARYKRALFEALGLADDTATHAVLLLGCPGRREIGIELGPAWPPALAAEARGLVRSVIVPKLAEGQPSAGFVAGAAELERLARGTLAAQPASSAAPSTEIATPPR